ncbi:alpha-galactosidase [Chitinophaga cymbidii]|uniref:Alpha-galactosidase n=1 Tax=Chitinophaga cymbidii TaxID=1096750 RepID=A0A512RPH1_9BACT|nr:alpha-galactosidase [Chitinophaga cymbidii]GEP97590.1 alpha-galactosidase [Chitinophaga cymbidii]
MSNRKLIATALSFFFLCAASASAQQPELVIPLGNKSRIVYDLERGQYDVIWNGKILIKDAYTLYQAEKAGDSRKAGKAGYSVSKVQTNIGRAKLYTIRFAGDNSLQQQFYVLPGNNGFITRLRLQDAGAAGMMAPVATDSVLWNRPGDNRALYVPFDNDMWARYNAMPLAAASFKGSEVSVIYNVEDNRGVVMGSLEQDDWKTGILLKGDNTGGSAGVTVLSGFSDSAVTHDVMPHGKVLPVNGIVYSPMVMVGFYDDWRDGMETFAKYNSRLHPRSVADWKGPTPMGWNSWGVLREKIRFDQAMKVVDFFADSLQGFRMADNTLFIDLDAFWDNMTPGGIDGDVSKLAAFVKHCKEKGLRPGIYWTPFADWGKSDRKVEGSTGYSYKETWTTQRGRMLDIDGGRAMDPTHPATQQRIVHTINRMKDLGFEMIKIDFLGHGAQESDRFFDPAVTTGMQAFKRGMQFLDSVLDNKMLVYAAISPNIATARYVHVRRIACDAFSSLDHTAYTLNSTGYGWWQSYLYDYVDADHIVFAEEADGVNRARLAAALVTGSILTGDDFSSTGKWSGTARRLLQHRDLLALAAHGKSFRPLRGDTGDRGVEQFYRRDGNKVYVALFNYGNATQTVRIPDELIRGRKKIKELFSGKMFSGEELQVPPADVRIFEITRN